MVTHSDPEELDRNWAELLQEVRVAQTGVQILTAFLLTVPFAPGFERLGTHDRRVFAAILVCALLSTLLLMAPVALHRQLFHQRRRVWLVDTAHRLAQVGLSLLVVAYVGAAWLVLDLILSPAVAAAAAIFLSVVAVGTWLVLPAWERRHGDP